MTIHSDHPFATPDPDKNPVRRLRGRLPAPVTIVATGAGRSDGGRDRVGLTVSSVLAVEPEHLILVVNELADLADELDIGTHCTVNLLSTADENLSEVFASLAPAPGGPFTVGDWVDSEWGPRLGGHSWAGAIVTDIRDLAWSKVVTLQIGHLELTDADTAIHLRGRFRD